jgi:hypothetical protein
MYHMGHLDGSAQSQLASDKMHMSFRACFGCLHAGILFQVGDTDIDTSSSTIGTNTSSCTPNTSSSIASMACKHQRRASTQMNSQNLGTTAQPLVQEHKNPWHQAIQTPCLSFMTQHKIWTWLLQ